jgi:hypothetical protein
MKTRDTPPLPTESIGMSKRPSRQLELPFPKQRSPEQLTFREFKPRANPEHVDIPREWVEKVKRALAL